MALAPDMPLVLDTPLVLDMALAPDMPPAPDTPLVLDMALAPGMPLALDMVLVLDTLWVMDALAMVLTSDLRSILLGLLPAKAYKGTC
jgi:hypothetical protein